MGKLHTHYDNLKVARLAPQEVIRAAYKALSQKYHPDKNPGDEKAARIMAIVNSAYGTLSDPQRRREHDEWITAEEWEIEWLDSTRQEEPHGKQRHDVPAKTGAPQPFARRRAGRDWKCWFGLAAGLGIGWLGGVLMQAPPKVVPAALASGWAGTPERQIETNTNHQPAAKPNPQPEPTTDAVSDSWAVGKSSLSEPAQIKIVALSQVALPGTTVDCGSAVQTLVAPNGKPWPLQSGYIEGFPIASKGDEMQLTVDNASNASAVFVKIFDLELRSNVRHVFVLAHDKLSVNQLALGKYEVRYQNIDIGGSDKSGCDSPPEPPASSALSSRAAVI